MRQSFNVTCISDSLITKLLLSESSVGHYRDRYRVKRRGDEIIRFLSPTDMPHVQAVYAENVTNEFPRHVHDGFCIGVVEHGVRIVSQTGMSSAVPKDSMFVINPGAAHGCRSQNKDGHSYLVICVDAETVRNTASQISDRAQPLPYIKDALLRDMALASQVRQFFRLLEKEDSFLSREAILTSMVATLIMRHGDTEPIPCHVGSQYKAVTLVREYIEEHFDRNLSLGELAAAACLSPYHFHRLFVKNTGASPHEYLMQIRIRKARELLLEGKSITSTALETGFGDQSHFTRFFKRAVGIAPGRFVKLHQRPLYSCCQK
jgi:AraC-like DNA-binding protein